MPTSISPDVQKALIDRAVSEAKNLPELIKTLQSIDPQLATTLTGKTLIASKTVWGTIIGMAVSWAVTHWALGWDAQTCDMVTGAVVCVLTVGLRMVTSAPITSVVTPATQQ